MPEFDLSAIFAAPLNRTGQPYMVVGSVAAITYGVHRLTNDLDAVLQMSLANVRQVHAAFSPGEFYVPPMEVLREEAMRRDRGHFNVIHHASGYKADVFLRPNDPLEMWAFARRREVFIEGEPVWIAPPELVIIRKLEFFRESQQPKHIGDIRGLLKFETLDLRFIEIQVERLGLREQWLVCQPSGH
ncbi:MAG: hypothetical protein WDN28_18235 [Chthoniobacter sp.]